MNTLTLASLEKFLNKSKDLVHESFLNEEIANCEFSNLHISGCKVVSSTYREVIFDGCIFYASNMDKTIFIDCVFINCEFHFTHFENCIFENCEHENELIICSTFKNCNEGNNIHSIAEQVEQFNWDLIAA